MPREVSVLGAKKERALKRRVRSGLLVKMVE